MVVTSHCIRLRFHQFTFLVRSVNAGVIRLEQHFMSINHLLRGPDPERVYAISHNRWLVAGDGPNADLEIILTSQIGMTWKAIFTISLLTLIFWIACFTVYASVGGDVSFLVAFCVAGAVPAFAIFVLNSIEESELRKLPRNIFVVQKNGCIINDIEYDRSILEDAELQYRIHVPTPRWSGSESVNSYSELDLVVYRNTPDKMTHRLVASKDDSCLKPAKILSSLTGIPLVKDRVAR